jgi:translation initiation factor 2B subunit (eIF-2B alpha/beta/delta family)/8-oxo-dGTP pyrophosphatase MutT (NUDIX family)
MEPMLVDAPVVSCFLRHRGEILLLRRSGSVGTYRGKWGSVAGYVEDRDPDRSALREIAEETGLEGAVLAARGRPFEVEDADVGKRWIVHPYLFDVESRDVRLDWESVEGAWVSPTSILRRDAVPELWTSYERVAPRVETVVSDRGHGSAYLSLRALEILRDRSAALSRARGSSSVDADADGDWESRASSWRVLRALATDLLAARPSMPVIENRIHRLMSALGEDRSPERIERDAHRAIGEALERDDEAARRGAALVAGKRVLTLSRSGTVLEALSRARPSPGVVVSESRPGGEGVAVAEELAAKGMRTALVTDAGLASALDRFQVQIVIVGADAVLASGAVMNKVGTRLAALAARDARLPIYALAVTDKVSPREETDVEDDPADLYQGGAELDVRNPRFEVTPARLLNGVMTERGLLRAEDVHAIVSEIETLSLWSTGKK